MKDIATCVCGRPSHFVEDAEGHQYGVAVCEYCIQEEAEARDWVAECEHQPVERGGCYVICVRCGGMQCADGTWLHPLRMPRQPTGLEAA